MFFLLVRFGLMARKVTVYDLHGKIGCIFLDIFCFLLHIISKFHVFMYGQALLNIASTETWRFVGLKKTKCPKKGTTTNIWIKKTHSIFTVRTLEL